MTLPVPSNPESVFTYGAPALKFGAGASDEIGFDLAQLGVARVLVITDAGVAATGTPQRVAQQMAGFGIRAEVFDGVHVEPTDLSMRRAIDHARETGPWDAFVAVGGGSAIDTAKAVNLLLTNPGELMDYINAPVGGGKAPVNVLKPLVAVPTTTGTGAESTTICVMDVLSLKVKTGISHARLRPTLAVVDPDLTMTQPAGVTASAGMDILCHALESYTARWYTTNEHKRPEQRVPYCGANPISDMWSEQALSLMSRAFRRAVRDGTDRRGPHRHGCRGDVRRPRLRQRRCAHPARQRLPDRRPGQELPSQGLRRGRADGAARHVGLAHGTRGVPVHLRRPRPSGTSGPRNCWRPTPTDLRATRTSCPRC